MGTVSNIIVGPASVSVDASDIGFTSGGVGIGPVKDMWSRPSLSGVGFVETVVLSERFVITTYFAEATLNNIKIAWGMQVSDAVDPDGTKFYFGGSSDVSYHELEFTGCAPGDGNARTIHFYRVSSVEFSPMLVKKGKEVIVPATFEAFLDEDRNKGAQLGWFKDET